MFRVCLFWCIHSLCYLHWDGGLRYEFQEMTAERGVTYIYTVRFAKPVLCGASKLELCYINFNEMQQGFTHLTVIMSCCNSIWKEKLSPRDSFPLTMRPYQFCLSVTLLFESSEQMKANEHSFNKTGFKAGKHQELTNKTSHLDFYPLKTEGAYCNSYGPSYFN